MAAKNLKQRLDAIRQALSARARKYRVIVYHDDGGRLYFERGREEVPTTQAELAALEADPKYNTQLVCIEYASPEELAA